MNSVNLLSWLNFFIADVRDGLGPFLGIFLKNHGFLEGQIGLINSLASFSALVFGLPFGILIDKTLKKRFIVGFCIFLIIIAVSLNYFFANFTFTLLAQIGIALSGAFLGPAFCAITLGVVGLNHYAKQTAKNEIYKHFGTLFGAILSFFCAYFYGIASIFMITALMGIISLFLLSLLKEKSINHKIARGELKHIKKESLLKSLMDKRVLLLSFVMFCFHLSNAYMLPLLSQRAHSMGVDSSGAYAALTIMIAQGTMIIVVFMCSKFILKKHDFKIYFYLIFISLLELIIRGFVAANFTHIVAMVFVQILDGIGAGITGVILPIMVAKILLGSGHVNAGFSLVLISGGVGGALSAMIAGFIAQNYSFFYAYVFLAFIAFIGLLFWTLSFRWFYLGK
ncbi:MFS transporter [Campylobacter sp. US33a]|uniref:MFS transporter n=1 Tax=Campylobacter sp. US33a TaxID=2498120 RepID=UPI0010673DC6|nr:MFS transporter [Campylobacter sp. US33a]TEY02341.1 MFS transporter [Campylobacter sp. US33a]